MASSLEEFLAVKDVDAKEKTLTLTAKDGSELDIDIKALPIAQIKRIRAKNTYTYPTPEGSMGQGVAELDAVAYTLNMAIAGVKSPNLKAKELLKKFKARNAEEVLTAIFPLTEIAEIAREVEDLSVGDKELTSGTDPDLIEEAKNS